MIWYNEPEKWEYKDNVLTMWVTPKTDYWRQTHYGFTVDDGPFFYREHGNEFEVSVKIKGDYKTIYDQMGLMLRINEKHWIKTGIEYVDGIYNFSTVATNDYSSWNIVALKGKPDAIWIKAIRKLDAVEIHFSTNGKDFQMCNIAYFPKDVPVKVGMMAASPDGNGFSATFEDFSIKHTPDTRRLEWAKGQP